MSKMHNAKNMVGARSANYGVSIFRRYFRIAKHKQPGRIAKTMLSIVATVELSIGQVAYA